MAFLGRNLAGMGGFCAFCGEFGRLVFRFVQVCPDLSGLVQILRWFVAEQSGLIQVSPGLRFGGRGAHGGHSDSLGFRKRYPSYTDGCSVVGWSDGECVGGDRGVCRLGSLV